MRLYFTIIICFIFIINALPQEAINPVSLLNQMMEKNKEVKTIEFNAFMRERIDGKMVDKTSSFKINISPRKVFVKQSFLGISLEALYAEGTNKNQMLIATVSFPWIQLNLDPFGKRVRDNHHHTIFEADFGYIISVTSYIMDKFGKDFAKMCTYKGIVDKNNKKCHQIIIENQAFRYNDYIVKKGENLTTIANRIKVNDFMILENNPDIDYYTDVEEGTRIKVPSDYAKKMVLFLNVENTLPTSIEIYDDKGLYANYNYKDIKINKTYAPNELSASFAGYHFR